MDLKIVFPLYINQSLLLLFIIMIIIITMTAITIILILLLIIIMITIRPVARTLLAGRSLDSAGSVGFTRVSCCLASSPLASSPRFIVINITSVVTININIITAIAIVIAIVIAIQMQNYCTEIEKNW